MVSTLWEGFALPRQRTADDVPIWREHGDVAVALRWSIIGRHAGIGAWGEPSEREILLMAMSHYRLRADAIVEDVTVFDAAMCVEQFPINLPLRTGLRAFDGNRNIGVHSQNMGDDWPAPLKVGKA